MLYKVVVIRIFTSLATRMRLRRLLPSAAGAAALALCLGAQAAPSAAAATAAPPTIQETFTPLACPHHPRTTLQLEGCAERRVTATDRTIDGLNARVFAKLRAAGRARLVQTNTAWLKYRDAACAVEASIYSGGSLQPVAYANCLVSIDSSHVAELKRMLLALSPAG